LYEMLAMTLAPSPPKPLVLGITGASGTRLGLSLLTNLLLAKQPVYLVPTQKALLVMSQELPDLLEAELVKAPLAQRPALLCHALGLPAEAAALLHWFSDANVGDKPASGTHLTRGMIVAPCSMGTLAKIAHGISDTLLTRSADVTLKEHRPLILMPRETPLNSIHLKNMLSLSEMGVRLIPPMLAFYSPEFATLEGQLAYLSGKVLDQLGIEHTLHTRWQGLT
jgi:4-hydroxy-3-polyprenylbenzoate decarboxylase